MGLDFKDLERILEREMVLVCDFNDWEKDSLFGKDWEGAREREREIVTDANNMRLTNV